MIQKPLPDAPLVEIKDLVVAYDQEIILNDINFTIYPKDFIGLIGPNGGGKTTLLKVILGLIKPEHGTVRIKNESPHLGRRNIGYVPQIAEYDTDFPISVQDIVRMGRLSPKRLFKPYTTKDDSIVKERLEWLDIYKYKERALRELSGGQRQRVYIARALVTEPELLLLDEPTISVDLEARTQIFDLLYEINQRGVAILLVSHDLTAISSYVKTIGCLNRKLFYEGKKEITAEMLEASYSCPIDLIAHGLPHRVIAEHTGDPS
ncbi:MAG: metal ABC transporter ATP-binding protein [Anaerolineales bacterium]